MKERLKKFKEDHEHHIDKALICIVGIACGIIYQTHKGHEKDVVQVLTVFDKEDKVMGSYVIQKNGEVQPFFKRTQT